MMVHKTAFFNKAVFDCLGDLLDMNTMKPKIIVFVIGTLDCVLVAQVITQSADVG